MVSRLGKASRNTCVAPLEIKKRLNMRDKYKGAELLVP